MRILYVDIDTLRPDHLGCYGYLRDTSPNIDRIAADGVRFDNCYVSDAPCLPSRASTFTGRFGIHSGAVNHGGLAADVRPVGESRAFRTEYSHPGFITSLRRAGMYPVSFSPFAERHSTWWFCEGWREMYNPGKGGLEQAHDVVPAAIDWVKKNAKRDDWMMHVHLWDPHTPYRAPEDFGNPFADEPAETWYTEEIRQAQWDGFGLGSPQEPYGNKGAPIGCDRQPDQIASMDDYRMVIDGYDCGVAYADMWIGRLLNALADEGVLDETAVVITSDHGENLGELGVIGDHALADHITSRVPMIVRWPGRGAGPRTDRGLHYQNDIAATLVELAGGTVPDNWDGRAFTEDFNTARQGGRQSVVVGQCCWSCMRSVRWDDYIMLRTSHSGLKDLRPRMLFNVADDPHELNNLAEAEGALLDHGTALLELWTSEMMATSEFAEDPLWTTIHEGGPYHTRGETRVKYLQRLRETGRGRHADFLAAHPLGV